MLLLIVGTAALRVALSSLTGLGFDESYAAGDARVLSLSYVDFPPLHVWLVGIWSWLTGSESPLVLRLPFIALFAGSTWLMFRLTARLFGESAGLWAAVFFNLAPMFTVAHSSWVLPDGPLIFFMLATVNIVVIILFERPSSHLVWWWIAAGLCGGLACLSKYHGVFLFLATFAFLLTVPNERRWLATSGPWLGVLCAAAVFSPVIVWNAQHGWVGVALHAARLSSGNGLTMEWFPELIGGELLYITPWLFIPLLLCLVHALWRGPSAPTPWLLGLLAVGPIVVFSAVAFFVRVLPHWPMPGWLFVFPLLGEAVLALSPRRLIFVRQGTILAAALIVLLAGGFGLQATTGAVGRAFPALFEQQDPTLDLIDWHELGTALTQRRLIDEATPAVAGAFWMEAAKANFAFGRSVPVVCVCREPGQFMYLHDLAGFVGRNFIVVGTDDILQPRLNVVKARFQRLEPLAPVILHRGGQPAMELRLFRGVGFKG